MKKLKTFLTEGISIPMWAILLFDVVALTNVAINLVVMLRR